ncbi:MAG TPA: hypothetical protein VE243_06475, partial [Candidatus Acidoferrum sp.]|nr:hypothetical protein [Candidatus Acidoferrum sp.]
MLAPSGVDSSYQRESCELSAIVPLPTCIAMLSGLRDSGFCLRVKDELFSLPPLRLTCYVIQYGQQTFQ